MEGLKSKLNAVAWQSILEAMNEKGCSIIPDIISIAKQQFISSYHTDSLYRKTVVMERYRFGLGEYKYFDYPLPKIIRTLRETIYPKLVPIVNIWMKALKINKVFPETLQGLQALCHQNNQLKPALLILKYSQGGFNTLHQDLYGEVYFPIQAVLFK